MDPTVIEIALGKRCKPGCNIQGFIKQVIPFHSPATEADDNITVWNHIGKKYMMEKLQKATRKLLIPTSTGIFCLSRYGVNTGSMAIFSSTTRKRRKNPMATTRDEITRASSHCSVLENGH